MNNRIIHLTDSKAERIVPEDDAYEPLPGSIALTEGVHGTCWQRYFSDGKWHSTTGQVKEWRELLARRNTVLVYDAEERPDRREATRPKPPRTKVRA